MKLLDISDWELEYADTNILMKIKEVYIESRGNPVRIYRKDFYKIINHPIAGHYWNHFYQYTNNYKDLESEFIKGSFKFLSVIWLIIEDEEVV